ncbi:hypothetical protein N431DRAFT_459050 [Stipitochalara longipes BDJ]|nr:hypothetical protein N431DRAFT_459050 [Stipitochalara longipes BDJ]
MNEFPICRNLRQQLQLSQTPVDEINESLENGQPLQDATHIRKRDPQEMVQQHDILDPLHKADVRATRVFIHKMRVLIVAVWVNDLMVVAKNTKDSDEFRMKMSSLFDMVDEGECIFTLG